MARCTPLLCLALEEQQQGGEGGLALQSAVALPTASEQNPSSSVQDCLASWLPSNWLLLAQRLVGHGNGGGSGRPRPILLQLGNGHQR
jgi:hypothetical protein